MMIANQGVVQSSYAKIVKDGLVAWFDAMNDNSYPETGTIWTSLASSSAMSGSFTNGPTFDTQNGGSINFDGIDDRVVIPHDANLTMGAADYTIETWVNFSTLPGSQGTSAILFRKNIGLTTELDMNIGSGSGTYGYRLLSLHTFGGVAVSMTSSTAVGITTNTWYYFCVTRQGASVTHYMTGSLIGTTTGGYTTLTTGTVSASIASAPNGNNRVTGKIAIVRVYKNKALTADEVRQNYNADKARFGY